MEKFSRAGRQLELICGAIFLFMIFPAKPALLLAEPVFKTSSLEIKTFLGLSLSQQVYPEQNFLYSNHAATLWAADARFLVSGLVYQETYLDLNIHQQSHGLPPTTMVLGNLSNGGGRSGLLTWEQHYTSGNRTELTIDTLSFRRQSRHVDLTIGRQPINLASTFYFTPNDFFEPFAAQTFYRTYKPGVDACRAEVYLENLSQMTLLAVLSYDQEGIDHWRKAPNWSETSFLGKFTQSSNFFEWSLLAGTVSGYSVAGGALQGELFEWLTIRTEGHYGRPETNSFKDYYKLTVGLEHFYDNGLSWRLEYFFNKSGFAGIDEVTLPLQTKSATSFLGKHYLAFGVSCELTPLLTGSTVALVNMSDESALTSLNMIYSLTDESEVTATLTIPHGQEPDMQRIGSEFGGQPMSLSVAYRVYF